MIKKIVEGYEKLFSSTIKIIGLLLTCAVMGIMFVLPLWRFATAAPKAYTLTIFAIIIAAVFFLCIKKIKSTGIKSVISSIAKLIIIIGCLSLCVILVLNGKRLLVIPTIILMIVLYGIISFGFKKTQDSQK